jgi:hypothetical protein
MGLKRIDGIDRKRILDSSDNFEMDLFFEEVLSRFDSRAKEKAPFFFPFTLRRFLPKKRIRVL